jgi:hypothetical protein
VDQQPSTSSLIPLVPIVHNKHLFDPQIPMAVIQLGVLVEHIKQTFNGYDIMKVTFHKLIMYCLQFHDPIDEYIELYFSNALEHAGLIFLVAFERNMGDNKN